MISVPDNLRNDNQGERLIKNLGANESDFKNLKLISKKTILELEKQNTNLLIFPQDFEKTKDKIADEKILTLENESDFESAKITTGNLMGFIGIGGTKLKIRSRFDENGQDYFLHYMLQKVFHLNLFDYKTESSREDIFDFLIYLFPQYLNQAMSQGIYKEYKTFERNDANIRGVIQVARHIRQNIPFAGKVAYKTREHSFDNSITHLIRHTIEFIMVRQAHQPGLKGILQQPETRENVQKIYAATETYKKQERQKIIHKNLKPLRAAFYTKYIPLQKLCKAILLHEQLKFGSDDKKVYGVLFDGAWLWEEYLATILKPKGFIHPENKLGKGGIRPFFDSSVGLFYPDFYNEKIVLDAKYKKFDEKNPPSDDSSQMISYMHILSAEKGCFIYPSEVAKEKSENWKLRGKGGEIFTFGFPIPKNCADFTSFSTEIKNYESKCVAELSRP